MRDITHQKNMPAMQSTEVHHRNNTANTEAQWKKQTFLTFMQALQNLKPNWNSELHYKIDFVIFWLGE